MSKVSITKSKLDNLANAVSAKSGIPILLTVDEMTDAVLGISVGEENILEGVKINGIELPIVDKKVNIPVVSQNKAGVMTPSLLNEIYDKLNNCYNGTIHFVNFNGDYYLPTYDSTRGTFGVTLTETDPTVPAWAKALTKPTYTASEVGALPDSTVIPKIFIVLYDSSTNTANKTYTEINTAYGRGDLILVKEGVDYYWITSSNVGYLFTTIGNLSSMDNNGNKIASIKQLILNTNNTWITSPAYTYKLPRNTSDLTNDSGFLTTDSDEKLAVTDISVTDSKAYCLIFGNGTAAATRHYDTKGLRYEVSSNDSSLLIGYNNPSKEGRIVLFNNNGYFITLRPSTSLTESGKHIYLPNTTGTLALTSQIPTIPTNISSFTNDSGYLTSSDLSGFVPIETGNITSNTSIKRNTDDNITLLSSKTTSKYRESKIIVNSDSISISSSGAIVFQHYNDGLGQYVDLMQISTVNTIIHNLVAPTSDGDAANKKYVDDSIGALSIPTKTSDLTNDSGFLTSFTETDPIFSASAAAGITASNISSWNNKANKIELTIGYVSSNTLYIPANSQYRYSSDSEYSGSFYFIIPPSGTGSSSGQANTVISSVMFLSTLTNINLSVGVTFTEAGLYRGYVNDNTLLYIKVALTSDIPDTSSFLTSETDPVFTASAAASITSTDISNWNAKVSDDKTWNGVTLNKGGSYSNNGDIYVPYLDTYNGTAAYTGKATSTPTQGRIAKYDVNAYLYSTTPSANDNSTKVATTAYVDAAIPTIPTNVSAFNNDAGYLTSYTDENVKQTPIGDSNSANYGLIVAYSSGETETTNFVRSTNRIYINNSTPSITVGKDTGTQKLSIRPDRISFIYNSGNHQGYLKANSITGNDKTWTLPDKTGTVALTSDIPQVYSSTNTGGYLTMATLPIYDGTVV